MDLGTKLWHLNSTFYDDSNEITKEFLDEILDEVISEYGLKKGSTEIFNIIQNRLSERIYTRSIVEMKDYIQGDILLIEEAIAKGFNINKRITLDTLEEKGLHNISKTLDEYYNSIYSKANKEAFNLDFYLKQQKEHLIAAGGPSLLSNEQNLSDMSNRFNNDVKQALTVSNGEVLLKDRIEEIKEQIKKQQELSKVSKSMQQQKDENKEIKKEKEETNEIKYSEKAGSISALIAEYQMKQPRRFASDYAAIDFDKLEDSIRNEVRKNSTDKSVAMVIAQSEPYFLQFMSEELQSDMDVVREVVKNNPKNAAMYVDEDLIEKIKKEEFEKQKQKFDSNSVLLNAVKNSYEQDKGRSL